MVKSKITSKSQVTIPREIRERLKVGPGDILVWEVRNGHAEVRALNSGFLSLRGSIKVGPGDVVADVKKARELRGLGKI